MEDSAGGEEDNRQEGRRVEILQESSVSAATETEQNSAAPLTMFPSPIPIMTTALAKTSDPPARVPPIDAHPIPTRKARRASELRWVTAER